MAQTETAGLASRLGATCAWCVEALGHENTPRTYITLTLIATSSFALSIIATLATWNVFPASTLGWGAVGVAGALFAFDCSLGRIDKRRFAFALTLLTVSSLIVMGALAGTGHLPTQQLGLGMNAVLFLPLVSITYALTHPPSKS